MFELEQFFSGVSHEVVNNILFAQPVTTGNGVFKMLFKGIVFTNYTSSTTFCGHGVAAHWVYLGNQCNLSGWILFCNSNSCSETSTTCTNYGDVGLNNLHVILLKRYKNKKLKG